MKPNATLDAALRMYVSEPSNPRATEAVFDFCDAAREALMDGDLRAWARTFSSSVAKWPFEPLPAEFWRLHRIDVPEYLATGNGVVVDHWWVHDPSVGDLMFDRGQLRWWLFRSRVLYWLKSLWSPRLPPVRSNRNEVRAAIARATKRLDAERRAAANSRAQQAFEWAAEIPPESSAETRDRPA
jgi:hypothetical protein